MININNVIWSSTKMLATCIGICGVSVEISLTKYLPGYSNTINRTGTAGWNINFFVPALPVRKIDITG
jgi:hypothetical protein